MKNKNSTKNNTANTANTATKPAKNPAEMTISELMELKKSARGLMVPIIEALITEKSKVEELQTRAKTSKVRDIKAPSTYDVLQPIFVAIRSSVGKNITADENLIAIFQYSIHTLKITADENLQRRLFEKTVLHNSVSNIAKAETLASAEGRRAAFTEMLHQAMIMLPEINEEQWTAYKKEYAAAYDKATKNLK